MLLFSAFKVKEPPGKHVKEVYDWLDAISFSLVVVVILFSFVFKMVVVDGESMENTLFNGDRVILSNILYKPQNGDVVVISRNYSNNIDNINEQNRPLIKRVIATEGQKIDIDFDNHVVYVDGIALEEPYIKDPTERQFNMAFPATVPDGHIFVMGDNRNNSLDSRSMQIGMIDERYVIGHVVLRVFPFTKVGVVN